MNQKEEIIQKLKQTRDILAEAISMIESNKNCMDIEVKIKNAILSLEVAQRQLLNNHLEVCLENLLKILIKEKEHETKL